MTVSTFMGIQTSLRGLLAQQRALDVTSHNVANASTVGYSRQEAVLGTTPALAIPAGALNGNGSLLGAGVDVITYQRVRDQFLDLQYRAQNMSLGEQSARSSSLRQVELSLAEPGTNGVSAALDRFWSAFGDLSTRREPGRAPGRHRQGAPWPTASTSSRSGCRTPSSRPTPSTARSPPTVARSTG